MTGGVMIAVYVAAVIFGVLLIAWLARFCSRFVRDVKGDVTDFRRTHGLRYQLDDNQILENGSRGRNGEDRCHDNEGFTSTSSSSPPELFLQPPTYSTLSRVDTAPPTYGDVIENPGVFQAPKQENPDTLNVPTQESPRDRDAPPLYTIPDPQTHESGAGDGDVTTFAGVT